MDKRRIQILRRSFKRALIKKHLEAALIADREELGGCGSMRKNRDNKWCLVEETPRIIRISDDVISALVSIVAAALTFYVALPIMAAILTSTR